MNAVLTPSAVWEGFDSGIETADTRLAEQGENFKRFVFAAAEAEDGKVYVDTEYLYPSFSSAKTVLLIGEFSRIAQPDVAEKLVSKGFNVFIPDYSGVKSRTETRYPESLSYGYFKQGGEHLCRVCPTARETSYYLYAAVVRRTLTFIESVAGKTDIVLMGIRSGAEIALQAAGADDRLSGLVLIGGAGYREYVDIPKYASGKELVIDDDMMRWLTGVSGTAYAKHVKVPVMAAVGSNGTVSDLDRISNLINLMSDTEFRLTVSSGCRDNIDRDSFDTVLQWLDGVFIGSTPPEMPTLNIDVNSDGELYALVKADCCIKVNRTKVYYSFGDNNHSTRFWRETDAEFSGDDEYLAKIKVCEGDDKLFVYAETEYANGLVLDGVVNYVDLTGLKVKYAKSAPNPIVFQHPDENGFIELSEDAVIMNGNLCEGVLPIGLKGLYCAAGSMVTYAIGRKKGFDETRLLQIDSYSAAKKYTLTVKAVKSEDETGVEYTVSRDIEVGDTFYSLRLNAGDFKDERFRSMENWEGIKSLAVCESNVIIGKIMFI